VILLMKVDIEEVQWSWAEPRVQELLLRYYRECLFSTPEAAEEDVQRVLTLASLGAPGRVLDIGCGLGYHAASFAGHGFEVFAFDPGERYLEIARRQTARIAATVELRRMECSALTADASFDLAWAGAYCPGQLEPPDLVGDFRRIHKALIPGRWFVATVAGKARPRFSPRARRWEEKEDCFVLEEEWTDGSHCYEESWFVFPGERRVIKVSETDRIYDVTEVEPLLREAGFVDIECYADLEARQPAEPGRHFAFRCRKPEA
jgi:SAM-dependent methyltransferase